MAEQKTPFGSSLSKTLHDIRNPFSTGSNRTEPGGGTTAR